jgi:hypothetical protein
LHDFGKDQGVSGLIGGVNSSNCLLKSVQPIVDGSLKGIAACFARLAEIAPFGGGVGMANRRYRTMSKAGSKAAFPNLEAVVVMKRTCVDRRYLKPSALFPISY